MCAPVFSLCTKVPHYITVSYNAYQVPAINDDKAAYPVLQHKAGGVCKSLVLGYCNRPGIHGLFRDDTVGHDLKYGFFYKSLKIVGGDYYNKRLINFLPPTPRSDSFTNE